MLVIVNKSLQELSNWIANNGAMVSEIEQTQRTEVAHNTATLLTNTETYQDESTIIEHSR